MTVHVQIDVNYEYIFNILFELKTYARTLVLQFECVHTPSLLVCSMQSKLPQVGGVDESNPQHRMQGLASFIHLKYTRA